MIIAEKDDYGEDYDLYKPGNDARWISQKNKSFPSVCIQKSIVDMISPHI